MLVHWNTVTSVMAAPSLQWPSLRHSRPCQWSWRWVVRSVLNWSWVSVILWSSHCPSRSSWGQGTALKAVTCGGEACSQAPGQPKPSASFPHKLTGTQHRYSPIMYYYWHHYLLTPHKTFDAIRRQKVPEIVLYTFGKDDPFNKQWTEITTVELC